MPSKQGPKSKTPSTPPKAKAGSSRGTRQAPRPQSIERFWGEVICVIGFPRVTAAALGPELLDEVVAEMNKTGIRFVFQDERCVVNLTTQVLAVKN